MHTPLTIAASSDARYKQAFATSSGVEKRPSGMVAMNLRFISSVTAPPANSAESPVSGLKTGFTQLTRILSGPNSAAIDFERTITAPFELLQTVRPGRGRRPEVEAMLTNAPPPRRRKTGTACTAER